VRPHLAINTNPQQVKFIPLFDYGGLKAEDKESTLQPLEQTRPSRDLQPVQHVTATVIWPGPRDIRKGVPVSRAPVCKPVGTPATQPGVGDNENAE